MLSDLLKDLALPEMLEIEQVFDIPQPVDPAAEVSAKLGPLLARANIPAGAEVAVGVGSRGIESLPAVAAQVVAELKKAGAAPFVMPAMGSHGGGTAEGQIQVLAERGITEQNVGAPVRANMQTVDMGQADGIPLFLSKPAHDAWGVILINRIKPHTNFIGKTESGILKMMAIGMGNQAGAELYHRMVLVRDQYSILSTAGRELIAKTNFLAGVCLVENQHHRLCRLEAAGPDTVEEVEAELLKQARSLVPGLPVEEVDLLIIDEMGKEISGQGIDPNVVGRDTCIYGAKRPLPVVSRIFVRSLTAHSKGSAVGLSQADFALTSLVEGIDHQVTNINQITACCPEGGKVPMHFATDRQVLAAALRTIRPFTLNDLGVVYIKNTLELSKLWVSAAYKAEMQNNPKVRITTSGLALPLDQDGNLQSPFAG